MLIHLLDSHLNFINLHVFFSSSPSNVKTSKQYFSHITFSLNINPSFGVECIRTTVHSSYILNTRGNITKELTDYFYYKYTVLKWNGT